MKWLGGLALGVVTAAAIAACSSSGGGGGGVPCDDAGLCPNGLVCQYGVCVAVEGGVGGAPGGGGGPSGGGSAGMGASGGFGGTSGYGGSGGFGATGGYGGSGGFGGTGGYGGSGGFGGTSGFGGTGGSSSCTSSVLGATCTQVFTSGDACDTCTNNYCCNETNACFADNECGGLMECISLNCSTATDINACVSQYCPGCATSASVALLNAFASCVQTNCTSQCGGA